MVRFIILLLFVVFTTHIYGQTIKVSVSNSPPLAYFDTDGLPKGLFVDILNEIALKEGWTLEYKNVKFSEGLNQLRSKTSDILVNVAITPERLKYIQFNEISIYTTYGQIFTKNEYIETIPDLEGLKVGYLNNDFFATDPEAGFVALLEHSGVNVDLLPFKSYHEVTKYLEDDIIDAAVFGRPYGFSRFLIRDFFEFEDILAAPIIFAPTNLYFGLQKNENFDDIKRTIDRHIIAFRKDKNSIYYHSLRSNLLTKKESFIPDWILILLTLSGTGLILFFVFIKVLETRVKQKTKQIQKAKVEIEDSNKKLSLALNSVREGIWEWDIKTNDIIVDQHSFNVMGYENAGERVHWSNLLDVIYPDDKPNFEKSFQNHFKDKSEFHEVTFRATNKDSELRWFLIHGTVVAVDEEGKPAKYLGTIVDIHDKKTIEEKLEESETKEREKISRELHDGVQQTLSAAVLNFNYILENKKSSDEVVKDKLKTGIDSVNSTIREIRTLAHELDFNIAPAIEKMVEEINDVTNTEITFLTNIGTDRLDHKVEKALFRVVQEAINNINKHSQATKATIQLMKYPDLVILTIEDNGKGFDTEVVKGKFGLNSMRSRSNHIDSQIAIDSTPGKGTTITIEVPIKEQV